MINTSKGAINPNPKVGYNGYYYVHSQTLASKYIYITKLSYDLFVCSSVQGTKPFHHKGGGEYVNYEPTSQVFIDFSLTNPS